jgi:CO/xanthine dehydrogenase Mo-binding subunit
MVSEWTLLDGAQSGAGHRSGDRPGRRPAHDGSKGIGEIGNVGPPAAVANAVFHAMGKRVWDLPIMPERLL